MSVSEPLMTMTEQVEVARRVTSSVDLPVIVDGGAGFELTKQDLEQRLGGHIMALEESRDTARVSYEIYLDRRLTAAERAVFQVGMRARQRNLAILVEELHFQVNLVQDLIEVLDRKLEAWQALQAEADSLSAADRRMVHVSLSDYQGVRTESVGMGEDRKVTIFPTSRAND